jgi:E3 ubiquitin-protein ligase DOA10
MPFDLIIIHIIVPAINRYFRPVRVIKRFWIKWMHFVCRQLRLTSFMFGVRTMDEEGVMRYPTWWGWFHGNVLQQHNHRRDGILEWNGQLVRAPKHDGVRFVPGRRMLVPVDTTTHLPLDQHEQRLGHPASQAPGGEEANTVIVYTPPRFKQRVITFMVALWLSGSALLCSLTILPLVLGRYVFHKGFHLEVPVHDMYSYFVGGIIILLAGAFVGFLSDVINDVVSQSNTTGRVTSFATHSKNIAYMVRKPAKKQTKPANQLYLYSRSSSGHWSLRSLVLLYPYSLDR